MFVYIVFAHHPMPTELQDGMGQLKVVPGGLQLTGQAWVVDQLRASNIRSRFGQPISLGKSIN